MVSGELISSTTNELPPEIPDLPVTAGVPTVLGGAFVPTVLGGVFARMYGLDAPQLDRVFASTRSQDLGLV